VTTKIDSLRACFCFIAAAAVVSASETLFLSGPQEFAGTRYYWLAEWKIEVTLPADVSAGDRFEVLFGSKGPLKRTLYFKYNGRSGSLAEVRKKAYTWIEIPIGPLAPGKKVILYGKGRRNVAFLAGVRIVGRSVTPPKVRAIPVGAVSRTGEGTAVWSDLPGFEPSAEMLRLWAPVCERPDWKRAERSARFAGIALDKVQRWLHERCLAVRDERTGLFRPTGPVWTYRDTAADCYPFYVWAAWFTDQKVLNTVMLETLKAEQRLCNHVDRLPVPYDMDAGRKRPTSFDRMIFGASEYAKDGLVPIVELTGSDSPWFGRLQALIDDIFKNARYDTPYGKIPSLNIEVNGELLQVLPRLYCATGDRKYLRWAHRLADYYLLPGGFVPSRLSDHGCEIIGGLGLLFAVDRKAAPQKADLYKPHLKFMFEEILRRGTNSDGIIVGTLQKTAGPHDNVALRDGWGYDFVAFLDYDLALGTRRYYGAIQKALSNLLKPRYKHFNWDHNSRDNIADSVEGGLYLLRWVPVPEGFIWADREIATVLVDHVKPERLWGTHKLEANTVRTVLIHTMLHTRNTIARPWRQGLRLGAVPCAGGIGVFMQCDKPYEGRLQFDIPRHRIYMKFRKDWPRLNSIPEWFTVEPDEKHIYVVENVDSGAVEHVSGGALSQGLPVRLKPGKPLRLIIRKAAGGG